MIKRNKLLFILFVLVTIALISQIFRVNTFNTNKGKIIDVIDIYDSYNYDAYIMRNEFIYISESAINIEKLYEDFVRIPKNVQVISYTESNSSEKSDYNSVIKNKILDMLYTSNEVNNNFDIILDESHEQLKLQLKNKNYNMVKSIQDKMLYTAKRKFEYEQMPNTDHIINNLSNKYVITQDFSNNKSAGVISYNVDGYELALNLENLYRLNFNKFSNLKDDYENKISDNVKANGPIYKVFDNIDIKLLVDVGHNHIYYSEDNIVYVKINNKEYDAQVDDILIQGDNAFLSLNIKKVDDYFYKNRFINIDLISNRATGLAIPKDYVQLKDDEYGVTIIKKNVFKTYIPINILKVTNDYVIVSQDYFLNQTDEDIVRVDTVRRYDEVIKVK